MCRDLYSFQFIPDNLKTLEMFEKMVEKTRCLLWCVLDSFRTQEMCNKAVHRKPRSLVYVPDRFKTERMYKKVVEAGGLLKDVPDWFVKEE